MTLKQIDALNDELFGYQKNHDFDKSQKSLKSVSIGFGWSHRPGYIMLPYGGYMSTPIFVNY